MDEANLRKIVSEMMANQRHSPSITKTIPKVDLPMLSRQNYNMWSMKVRSALKLHDLWVDPTKPPSSLEGDDIIRNQQALLFIICYLDEQNMSFINANNDKCFISVWNEIKKFHQPRTATVLTDIMYRIMSLKHRAGQPIDTHLMSLDEQFARLTDIGKSLSEDFIVAIILSSVRESSDFAIVFHSAMWEDESSLTIAKVKSVLITTQRDQQSSSTHGAHHSKSFNNPANKNNVKKHNRRMDDAVRGWRCTLCEMDNHTPETCRKRNVNQNIQAQRQSR